MMLKKKPSCARVKKMLDYGSENTLCVNSSGRRGKLQFRKWKVKSADLKCSPHP